jgi:hypothetical protein
MSYAQVARMGLGQASTDAARYLSGYSSNSVSGRYLNAANGFSPLNGTGYWIYGRRADNTPISTSAELQSYNAAQGRLAANPTALPEN